MGAKLFVGNLSQSANGPALVKLFSPFGNVKWADVAMDPESGHCRGFGFVQMQSEDQARRAAAALRGRMHDGRRMFISVAKPRGAAAQKTSPAGPPRTPSSQRPNPTGRPHRNPRRN